MLPQLKAPGLGSITFQKTNSRIQLAPTLRACAAFASLSAGDVAPKLLRDAKPNSGTACAFAGPLSVTTTNEAHSSAASAPTMFLRNFMGSSYQSFANAYIR